MDRPLDAMGFAARLRERRKELELSQPKLAAYFKARGMRGYSQQNLVSLEKGTVIKDSRRQAMDLAEPLRTTAEWLLYGTGKRDTGPRPMTPEEYANLPFDVQLHLTEMAANQGRRKKA